MYIDLYICFVPRSTPFAAPVPSGHLVTAATVGDVEPGNAAPKPRPKPKPKPKGVPKAKSAVQEATQVFGR